MKWGIEMAPVTKTLLTGLPVRRLLDVIHPMHWQEITIRQAFPGSAHHATQAIYLRGPRSFLDPFGIESVDYPLLQYYVTQLMPVIRPLLKLIEYSDLGRVMLVKLPAGKTLDLHCDEGAYAEHYQRFHVALSGNAECSLTVYDDGVTKHHADDGDAFWFNHRKQHTASNLGDSDRVHLIVDAVPNPEWRP